jgi:predicted dehydrogenase
MSVPNSSDPIGVGILGAGPVTQAIHLPTLARLTDRFRIVRIMDVDPAVAESVASRVGAAWTSSQEELLADPEVEVVAICSPHPFHAEQVIAACRAGKRAVLCEKPFAMSGEQASAIADVSAETGVPIIVGTMHVYDAGWRSALESAPGFMPHTIRSSILLPPNPRFEDFATEVVRPDVPPQPPADPADADAVAAGVTGGIMGLAIHNLPHVRRLLDNVDPELWRSTEVVSAEGLAPAGYLVELRAGDVTIELHAVNSENWAPDWRLVAVDDDTVIDVDFTPSYVQAGSATATVRRAGVITSIPPADHNGYEAEWRHLAELADGAEPLVARQTLIDDLVFALDIAEKSAEKARAAALERSRA